MSVFDLHSHSNLSDGELSPTALVARAKSKGVDYLALTDHDTFSGMAEAKKAAAEEKIQLITGVEVSAVWNKLEIHIVGLDFQSDDQCFAGHLQKQCDARWQRAEKIALKLEQRGIPGTFEEAQEMAEGQVIGRPIFAQILVNRGVVKDRAQAFKKYLKVGKPAYVMTDWVSMEESIEWIHQAGGLAVLAHPGRYPISKTKLRSLITAFKSFGGDALEVSTATHKPTDIDILARLSCDNELYSSQGSDFHLPESHWAELGKFPPLPKICEPIWMKRNWHQRVE
ncbi:MAG: phosphatase [Gammaproteobacteria bacterium]|nr:MAG: phosphatase [Gammaproteobacteria bacterium]